MVEPAGHVAVNVDDGVGAVVDPAGRLRVDAVDPRADDEAGAPRLGSCTVLLHPHVVHRRARIVGVEPSRVRERRDGDVGVRLGGLIGDVLPVVVRRQVVAVPLLEPRARAEAARGVDLDVGCVGWILPVLGPAEIAALAGDLLGAPREHRGPVEHPPAHEHTVLVWQILEMVGRRDLGRDRRKAGRRGACGPPLRPTQVRAADHPHFAGAPRLGRDPLHEIVAVGLVERVERVPLAARVVAPAHICGDDDVAALGEPDRPGPCAVVVVGCGGEDGGRRARCPPGGIYVDGQFDTVPHGHENAACDVHVVVRVRVVARVGRLRVHAARRDADNQQNQAREFPGHGHSCCLAGPPRRGVTPLCLSGSPADLDPT